MVHMKNVRKVYESSNTLALAASDPMAETVPVATADSR